MQDKYAADIGDYAKYGLLRWLSGMTSAGRELSLGVQWYRFDGHDPATNDGQRTDYLNGQNLKDRRLTSCDEDLAEKMRAVLNGHRSIQSIEQSGVLPESTCFFGEGLNFDDNPSHARRVERRKNWNAEAFKGLDKRDVIFIDPDNGIKVTRVTATSRFGPKYVYCNELSQYWQRGQSLIVYQHFDRDEQRIQKKSALLRKALGIDGPAGEIMALSAFSRVFFVIPNPANPKVAELLRNRVRSFMDSPWGEDGHFMRVDC